MNMMNAAATRYEPTPIAAGDAIDEQLLDGPAREPEEAQFTEWAERGTNGLAWVAYPMIRSALRRFRDAMARESFEGAPFAPNDIERLIVPRLFSSLKQLLSSVMVLELNVQRIRGSLRGTEPADRFRSFCDSLRRGDVRQSIADEYPILFRLLCVRMENWADYHVELLVRLSRDWTLIQQRLALGAEPGALTAISAGQGDEHRRGRSVAVLEFASGFKLVYKPRSWIVDVHFSEFLEWVNRAGFEPNFRTVKIIDRGSYGWSEFITHEACSTRDQVQRYYGRLGGYLAIFYALKATDMHHENLIAAGEYPAPVDLETLFHADPAEEEDPALGLLQHSVMRVLLLPRRTFSSHACEGLDLSAMGVNNDQFFPAEMAFSFCDSATDEMRLVPDKSVVINSGGSRPTLLGREVDPEDFLEDFVVGFERVYRLMMAGRDALLSPGGLLDRFKHDEVRFIARNTSGYRLMLWNAVHPDLCRSPADRDQLFDQLWDRAESAPFLKRIISDEQQDLRGGDIPYFSSRPDSRDLWSSRGERLPEVFDLSVYEVVRERFRQLTEQDLRLQTRLIRASIIVSGGRTLSLRTPRKLALPHGESALGLARAVGDALCRDALEHDSHVGWFGLTPVGPREASWSVQPLGRDFYSGLSGCAFFLAYLGKLTGEPSYAEVARKSIRLAQRQLARRRDAKLPPGRLGGYFETGGMIYALTHLAVLWENESLIDDAKLIASQLPSLIAGDRMLDVLGGCAGCIPALAALNSISPSDGLLETAVLCGERLLREQLPQTTGAAWKSQLECSRPLTGFSHGAAGIAWALLKLSAWSGESRFRLGAQAAVAYERSTFVPSDCNWPDYRLWEGANPTESTVAWCHGAPGIGLARMDNLDLMDDRETRDEIGKALEKTLGAGFGLSHHCLCHGDLGNLDVLLVAAQKLDAGGWSDAWSRRASEITSGIAERGVLCGPETLSSLGLMCGLAGVGYGVLRIASAGKVPSVLLLAPPACA